MSNPNYPAYPTGQQELVYQYDPETGISKPQTFIVPQGGMTIRQRFVMAAMQGLCANPYWGADDTQTPQAAVELSVAHHACRYADAALAEEARTRRET